jgi:hypothetical protein
MSIISPNALSRRRRAREEAKRMTKGSDLERQPFGRYPADFVLATTSQLERVQRLKNEVTSTTTQSCTNLVKVIFHSIGGFCPGGCLEEVFVLFWGFYDFGVCVFKISVVGGWVFFSPCSLFQVGGDLSGSFGFLFSAPGSSYQIWWDTSGSFFFKGGWDGEEVAFIFSSCAVGF